MVVCQPEVRKFKKGIIKGSPFNGDKLHHIEVGLQMLLLRREIEDGKDAPKKHINSIVTICQPEDKEFKKDIIDGSSSNGLFQHYFDNDRVINKVNID